MTGAYGNASEECMRATAYLMNAEDDELRKIGPEMVKARNVILADSGSTAHRSGWEVIGDFRKIMYVEKAYGEKTAARMASHGGYSIKPLIDVMRHDADSLGMGEMSLHEVYEKVMENKETSLYRLVNEMAPYNEILDAAKQADFKPVSGAAKKVYDFDSDMRSSKREYMRKLLIPVSTMVVAPHAGLAAAGISALTLAGFSYSREAVYRLIRSVGRRGYGGSLSKVEGWLNKAGMSVPYIAILGVEEALDIPINWGSVFAYTVGIQGTTVAARKAKKYLRKVKAVARALGSGWDNGTFWETVDRNNYLIEAEEQLAEAPDPKRQGLWRRMVKYFNQMKYPIGEDRYLDIMSASVCNRQDERKIVEKFMEKISPELKNEYKQSVYDTLLGEYLPHTSVGEKKLTNAVGVRRTVVGAALVDRCIGSENKRYFLRRLADMRAEFLDGDKNLKIQREGDDISAFHRPDNEVWSHFGPLRLKEIVYMKSGHDVTGTAEDLFENGVANGTLAQFPLVRKTSDGSYAIKGWKVCDYRIIISDMLSEEEAVSEMYHESLHVGDRLEAFENIRRLGRALLENDKFSTPAGNPKTFKDYHTVVS